MTTMAIVNNNNNKESFELLRGSFDSNSFSDASEIVFPMKKKKYRRRLKNNPSIEHERTGGNKECYCKIRNLALALFCMISICWLVVLTWLTVVLHSELSRLTSHVSTDIKMNPITHANVPLQGGKKMKKRKELDALVAKPFNKRNGDGLKRSSNSGGVDGHDKLLTDSTDDADYWTSASGNKPRYARRGFTVRKQTCFTFIKMCSAILIFACVVVITTVMWLFVDFREQVSSFKMELNQVVAGNQGVPDALQKCHSLSKDLQKNQTLIMSRLSSFSLQLVNFSLEMTEVKSGLQTVQDQLRSSPDLVNIPRLIKDLSATVASFGSQIKDLNSTVFTLKDQNGKLDSNIIKLVQNITQANVKLNELSKSNFEKEYLTRKMWAEEKEALLVIINEFGRNLSVFNNLFSSKWKYTEKNQSRNHQLMETLQLKNENLTARVKTLEGLCAKQMPEESVDTKHYSTKP